MEEREYIVKNESYYTKDGRAAGIVEDSLEDALLGILKLHDIGVHVEY